MESEKFKQHEECKQFLKLKHDTDKMVNEILEISIREKNQNFKSLTHVLSVEADISKMNVNLNFTDVSIARK